MSIESQQLAALNRAKLMSYALRAENYSAVISPCNFSISQGYTFFNEQTKNHSSNVNLVFTNARQAQDFAKLLAQQPFSIVSGATGAAKSVQLIDNKYHLVFNEKNTKDFVNGIYQLMKSKASGSNIFRDLYAERQEYLLYKLEQLAKSCNPCLELQKDHVGVRVARQTDKGRVCDDVAISSLLEGNTDKRVSLGTPQLTKETIQECRLADYYTFLDPLYVKALQDTVFAQDKHQEQRLVRPSDMAANEALPLNTEKLNIYQALAKVAKVQANHFLYKDPFNPIMSGMVDKLGERTKFTEIVVSGPRPYSEARSAWLVPNSKTLTERRLEQNMNIFHEISDMIFKATIDRAQGTPSSIFLNRYSLGSHKSHIFQRLQEAFTIANKDGKGLNLYDPIADRVVNFCSADKLAQSFIFNISASLIISMAKHGDNINHIFTDFNDKSEYTLIQLTKVIEAVKYYITNKQGIFKNLTDEQRTQYLTNISKFKDKGASDLLAEAAKYKAEHPGEHVACVISASAGTTAGIAKGQYFASGTNGDNDLRSEEVSTIASLGGILPVQAEERHAIIGLSKEPECSFQVATEEQRPIPTGPSCR